MLTAFRTRRSGAGGGFLRDRRGASAVEFALLLPIMLMLLVGMTELANAIDNWRKVTSVSRTVADLTSLGDPSNSAVIQSATMTDILASSTAVLRPYGATTLKVVVSAMAVDHASSPTHPRVCSSTANSNGSARATGVASDLTIPVGFTTDGSRYVLAEVNMPYAPVMGSSLVSLVPGVKGPITLKASFPWPTRGGQAYTTGGAAEVILPGGSKC